MMEVRRHSRKEYWLEAQERLAKGDDMHLLKYIYGIEIWDTEEEYINRGNEFVTFAVLTPDGKWHERGKMGWWAAVIDEEETPEEWAERYHDRFIKDLDPNSWLIIVDCHI